MPFAFTFLCDLLQHLDDNQQLRTGQKIDANIVKAWFEQHRGQLNRGDTDPSALLSTLLPDKRTDRVYGIQAPRLQKKIARVIGLGRSRIAELSRWTTPGSGVDLGDCVERILTDTPNPIFPSSSRVTVEEIDTILHAIARRCRFSSPAIRSSPAPSGLSDPESALAGIFARLSARDAKWFTRLILKDYRPVTLDPYVVYRCYHPLLPSLLKIQDDFAAAARLLHEHLQNRRVIQGSPTKSNLVKLLKPTLGIKVGRQQWLKGRSIKHCLDMGRGLMSCEKKIDGEYCQIHIDLSKGKNCIQIFSKSGKDSTQDRFNLHEAIRASLKLGQPSCRVKSGAILEGELVVYSEKEGKILDFDKIRKHVHRSGSFLSTEQDSQPHHWEHLMIIYFDILMLDDETFLPLRHSERFKRLAELIECKKGAAELVQRQVIDFGERDAASTLRRAFGQCIVSNEEGLVLKPDDPYFDFSSTKHRFSCSNIKLKKEYFQGFGDVGDLAVVGGRYEPAAAKSFRTPNVKWTHFYLGCLENKEEVQRWAVLPRFVVLNVVELSVPLMETLVRCTNPEAVPVEEGTIALRIEPGTANGKWPTHVFTNPPVCDVRCFSFHKQGNTGFWSLRFPAVTKFHLDRSILDVMTFGELQELAEADKGHVPVADSQELEKCIALLKKADPKGAPRDRPSQSTTITSSPASSPPTCLSKSPNKPFPPLAHRFSPTRKPQTAQRAVLLPEQGAMTPPRSSAVEGQAQANWSSQSPGGKTNRKHGPPGSPGKATQRPAKRAKGIDTTVSSSLSSSQNPDSSPRARRRPLGDIPASSGRVNTLSGEHQHRSGAVFHSQPQLNMEENRETPGTDNVVAQLFCDSKVKLPSDNAPDPSKNSRRYSCNVSGAFCPFSNFSAIIAPDVPDRGKLEELLSRHGIKCVGDDPEEWKPLEGPPNAQVKLALVQGRDREATLEFFQRVEEVGLEWQKGKREFVEVYDWRMLEPLTEREAMQAREETRETEGMYKAYLRDIISRHWVGLA